MEGSPHSRPSSSEFHSEREKTLQFALVAGPLIELDDCRDAIGVLADRAGSPERDGRDHIPDGPAIDENVGCVCRIRGRFSGERKARQLVHIGTAYKPTPRQQIDLHFGLGLSSAAVDHFIGVGYSFRVRAVRR